MLFHFGVTVEGGKPGRRGYELFGYGESRIFGTVLEVDLRLS